MKKNYLLVLALCAMAIFQAKAQAKLSIQGTVQNFNGSAVENGEYDITFKLYETDAGGTAIWQETRTVNVNGGVYSILLGEETPLDAPFNTVYYLGITLPGGPELTPRAQLTSSPYALSLIGQDNAFPSTGTVGVGTTTPDAQQQLHVVGNTKLEGNLEVTGTVTGFNVDFTNIETDISTIENINADGTITAGSGLNLPAGQSIAYNGKNDWRLVEVDDFSQNTEGWVCHKSWSENTVSPFERFSPNTPFSRGYILRPTDLGINALKKQFDLSGIPHTEVKVVFTYHFFETWDAESKEFGYAVFATTPTPTRGSDNGEFQIGWVHPKAASVHFGGIGYVNFQPGNSEVADYNMRGEMMAQTTENTFWLIFSSNLNEVASNEGYGISNVEIWVR